MRIFLFVLELIGTIAFAVSGAMVGLKKKMDIFGIIILGLTTAVGGGIIRDLILGNTPPYTFTDPVFALSAIATSVIVFIPLFRHFLMRNHKLYDRVVLIMDSLGLGIFSVNGVIIAYASEHGDNLFLLLFVGAITGVGGGVMRDIMAGNTPFIFVKHIYACASLAGAAVCIALLKFGVDTAIAIISGMTTVFVIRIVAAHFKLNLPRCNEEIE